MSRSMSGIAAISANVSVIGFFTSPSICSRQLSLATRGTVRFVSTR